MFISVKLSSLFITELITLLLSEDADFLRSYYEILQLPSLVLGPIFALLFNEIPPIPRVRI